MRPLGAIAFALLIALAAWLAIANRVPVLFSLDALHPGDPRASAELPLFVVLFLGVLAGLVIGALYMLPGRARLRARLEEETERAGRLQALLAEETLAAAARPQDPAPPSRNSD